MAPSILNGSMKYQGHVDYGDEDPDHPHDDYILTEENCCTPEALSSDTEFTILTPKWFKNWLYSSSNELAPYLETLLFVFDVMPVMLMC